MIALILGYIVALVISTYAAVAIRRKFTPTITAASMGVSTDERFDRIESQLQALLARTDKSHAESEVAASRSYGRAESLSDELKATY